MKLQVTQENLNRALSSVGRVASSRGTLPILSNILIRTSSNRLSVAATNLNIAITHYIGAKVQEEGAITVPARLMQDFVGSLPGSIINLELIENKLHITTDQYQSIINGIPADDYPVMPAIAQGHNWNISAKFLKSGLQQVVFAASNDETRPTLTGVFIHSYNGKLYLVATDSYRLAEKMIQKYNTELSLLVPASALQDLLRVMGDTDTEIEVVYDDQQVLFRVGDIEIVTRLIEGTYPDYRKLIPAKFNTSAVMKRADLNNITKVSSLFARESAGSVTINLNKKDNQVSIRSIASQLGENTASASATVVGDGVITLNSRYILDALHVMNGEDVSISFNDKLEPCVLTDPASADYLHVVMPLKS